MSDTAPVDACHPGGCLMPKSLWRSDASSLAPECWGYCISATFKRGKTLPLRRCSFSTSAAHSMILNFSLFAACSGKRGHGAEPVPGRETDRVRHCDDSHGEQAPMLPAIQATRFVHTAAAVHCVTTRDNSASCSCRSPHILVLPAQVLGVNESARLATALKKEHIPCRRIIVNQVS